jgi:hypothetical protein
MLRPRLTVLLLVNDTPLREFMLDPLVNYDVTVVEHPDAVAEQLRRRDFSLVIVTNFGVSPWDAVAIIPEERDYPVLFLTGHFDSEIESACTRKHIPVGRVPIDLVALRREIRLALDDVS